MHDPFIFQAAVSNHLSFSSTFISHLSWNVHTCSSKTVSSHTSITYLSKIYSKSVILWFSLDSLFVLDLLIIIFQLSFYYTDPLLLPGTITSPSEGPFDFSDSISFLQSLQTFSWDLSIHPSTFCTFLPYSYFLLIKPVFIDLIPSKSSSFIGQFGWFMPEVFRIHCSSSCSTRHVANSILKLV